MTRPPAVPFHGREKWDEGVDALTDTGGATADGISSVGDTNGAWFD